MERGEVFVLNGDGTRPNRDLRRHREGHLTGGLWAFGEGSSPMPNDEGENGEGTQFMKATYTRL